ncbi:DUF1840 domain-containing protein [Ramlibacter sp. H39-3-26]|uniref:DUF1840 domain-containing protein n=1 Tax=Curvibacter soli TaxID=3031331 RepID=UPI0023D9DE6C|nr:DUF1840 domain-containing protein [Ramlibacter sp. H39-3-26]MDF1484945.1 DUF1840 domain-containing protein [Ramlibacter sp. H39-3-26]
MLFKFKSQAVADVIMLDADGREMLKIIGKEPSPTGIVTVAQVPAAIAAIEAAVVRDEARPPDADDDAQGEEDDERSNGIRLRQRAVPFIDLLRRSAAAGKDVVWGV